MDPTAAGVIEKWSELRKLTGRQLLDGVERSLGMEQDAQLRFLLYLAEVERTEAYELANVHSLWTYIEKKLGFAEYETRLRYHSARLLVRLPQVARYLADGRLNMTTLVLMKDVLTSGNVRDWCEKAANKSKAQVERLLADSNPSTVIEFGAIRQGPAAQVTEVAVVEKTSSGAPPIVSPDASSTVMAPEAPGMTFLVTNAPSKASVKALTARQSQLQTTLSKDAADDLEELRDLLSEIFPDRSIPKVVGYCLKEVKVRILKKRGKIPVKSRGVKDEPAPSPAPIAEPAAPTPEAPKVYALKKFTVPRDAAIEGRNSDRKFVREAIPAWVARVVWMRDNQCCQRKLKGGKICGSTYQCQMDHIRAVADGGSNEPSNLQIHCRAHNLRRARERFGTVRIERAIRKRQEQRGTIGPMSQVGPPTSARDPSSTRRASG